MSSIPDSVSAKLPHLPDGPGVYLWKGGDGRILYVGKAKRLRSRVRSYFAQDHYESPKTRHLVKQIADLETIVVPSEAHALILEANLIKEYRPRFNIALRDDKSYPYIKVTVQEAFPRVYVTRQLQSDGARYFGPYTDVGQMRRALNVVKRIFTVRSCNYDMPREMPERPCLDYFIKRCKAPCILAQSQEDYRAMIDEVLLFLDGKPQEVARRIRDRMEHASNSLDFERAAELRDALSHVARMEEPTVVSMVEGGDRDIIGYARDADDACVVLLRVRGGKLLSREHRFLENIEGEGDPAILSAYLAGSYIAISDKARDLLVPFDFEDRDLLEQSMEHTRVQVPQRGPRRELIELGQQNARHLLEELRLSSAEGSIRAGDPVYELAREIGLQKLPRTMVCFDISTTQGTDTVGSCVWFENGRAKRGEYRKFKVKTVEGTDDFASMREVVTRYFQRRINDEKPLPDLVVVDGGKGQLSSAHEALTALGLGDRPLISLAKRDEEVFVWGRSEPVRMSRRSTALRMLQQLRDEAHRFAITYNRKRRTMRTVTSELLKVPGIGPVKRRLLIQEFGSVQGVRDAGEEAIAKVRGFNAERARKLLETLAANSPV
ncbi:MAG TPA: excinuclease ABC subunit UvrC [Gemmatimonadaceae bacterium]|nr:excinuclease ABC subunit UvrC [Gemmatimonadaceae bacterium]